MGVHAVPEEPHIGGHSPGHARRLAVQSGPRLSVATRHSAATPRGCVRRRRIVRTTPFRQVAPSRGAVFGAASLCEYSRPSGAGPCASVCARRRRAEGSSMVCRSRSAPLPSRNGQGGRRRTPNAVGAPGPLVELSYVDRMAADVDHRAPVVFRYGSEATSGPAPALRRSCVVGASRASPHRRMWRRRSRDAHYRPPRFRMTPTAVVLQVA